MRHPPPNHLAQRKVHWVCRQHAWAELDLPCVLPARGSLRGPSHSERNQVQQRVVSMLERHLRPGGYLFISHSESLNGVAHGLRWVAPAIYQRRTS